MGNKGLSYLSTGLFNLSNLKNLKMNLRLNFFNTSDNQIKEEGINHLEKSLMQMKKMEFLEERVEKLLKA